MLGRKLFSKNAKIKIQNDHGTIIPTLKFHGATVTQDAVNKTKIANKGRGLKNTKLCLWIQRKFPNTNSGFLILQSVVSYSLSPLR